MKDELATIKPSSTAIETDEKLRNRAILADMQSFQKAFLQKEPKKSELKTNKFANNSVYLPISFLEMTLDEIFFGLWQTKGFSSKVVANELVGEIELQYFHPIAKVWLSRIGCAGVQIQYEAQYEDVGGQKVKKKVDITDISKKITNTLTKDYPHLKAQCFRNACLSIGKSFGRDLNREFEDQYVPAMQEAKPDPLKVAMQKIIEGLAVYKGEDKELLKTMCSDKQNAGEFTMDIANDVAKRIGIKL